MSLLDWIGPIGSGVQGLFNLGSSALGNRSQRKMQREQNEFNANQAEINRQFQSREAEIARDWQEQQYLQYSSPGAMVKQYSEAGLNPALMYGSNLQTSTGSSPLPSGSTASGSTPTSKMADMTGLAQAFLGLSKLKQDIEESKSREAANYAGAEKSYSGIRVDNATVRNLSVQNERMLSQISNDNKKVSAEVRYINGQLARISVENKVSFKQIEQMDAHIRQMDHQNALNDQQKLTLAAQQTYLEFLAEESFVRQNEIISQTRLNNANVSLIEDKEFEQEFTNKFLQLYGAKPSSGDYEWLRVHYLNKGGKKIINSD